MKATAVTSVPNQPSHGVVLRSGRTNDSTIGIGAQMLKITCPAIQCSDR